MPCSRSIWAGAPPEPRLREWIRHRADPAEAMIGWPEFQTKDGKLNRRAWAPGSDRIPPNVLPEAIETTERTRTSQAMLYAAPTG